MTSLLPQAFRLRLAASLGFGLWFAIVYLGCDLLAQGFAHRFSVHTAWDDRLPFVPELGLAYLLINPLLLFPVFAIGDTARFLAFCATLAFEVAIAGAVFLLFPVEATVTPEHGSVFLAAGDLVNLYFNNFPSLHVALAVSVGMAMGKELRPVPLAALWGAVLLVAASTVLTRQHFLLDAVAGAVLALVTMRLVFPRVERRLASGAGGRTQPCPPGSPGYGSYSSDRRPRR